MTSALNSKSIDFQWIPDSSHTRPHPYIVIFRGISEVGGQKATSDVTVLIYVGVPIPPPLRIDEFSNSTGFILAYPNPAVRGEVFEVDVNFNAKLIRLFDIHGKCVFSRNVEKQNKLMVETNGLTRGIYMFSVIGADGSHATGKFIVQ